MLLETSIIVNEANSINAATGNRKFTVKTGNGNKHQQNMKKVRIIKR